MYLKRLEMRGFKSFADKTVVKFDEGVTCIVGPNGSGKSNITDAVRWVLGEQKIKTLRGTKMEDIIFNGTHHRKKLGMAEVSLIFDNSEKFFPLDFNEVKICRRVYRSGESEYILNDTNCRLKDVKDLFMDTGIGTDGYSIIGQGRIESVLSNNKDERRLLFEEAAGIVKYKTRKRDTERKLENTQGNLIRIEDIFIELSGRVEPLRIESEKAKRHIEISDRLSELELNLFVTDIEKVDKNIEKQVTAISDTSKELESYNKSKEQLYITKKQYGDKIENHNVELQTIKNSFFEDKEKIANIDGEINVIEAKVNSFESDKNRMKIETESNDKNLFEAEKNIVILKEQKEKDEEKLTSFNTIISTKESSLENISKNLYDGEAKSGKLRDEIISKLNEIEKNKTEISSYKTILENHTFRDVQLNKEIEEAEVIISKELSNELIEENQLTGLKNTEDTLKEENYKLRKDLDELEKNITKDSSILNDSRKKLTEYTTESNLLKQMEKEYTGFDNSVRKALKLAETDEKLNKGINGVVASLMSIPKEYEVALEVSLGKSIQNVVTETPEDAKAMIKELKRTKSGRVTFIPLSTIKSKGDQNSVLKALKAIDGFIGKANELVEYENKYKVLYEYLIGRTVIVKDADTATEILKIKDLRYKVVTLDGDVFIPGGTITGGLYKSRSAGILSRKRKLIELDDDIKVLNENIDELSKSLQKLKESNQSNKNNLEQNLKISEGVRLEIVKKDNEIKGIKDQIERMTTTISKRKSEKLVIENDILSLNSGIEAKQKNIILFEKDVELLESSVTKDATDLDDLKNNMKALREELTDIKIENASLIESYKNQDIELHRMNSEKESIFIKNKENEKNIKEVDLNIESLKKKTEELLNSKNSIKKDSLDKDKNIEAVKSKINKLEKNIRDINNSNKELYDTIENLKDSLHKLDIKKAKFDVHKEDIAARLFEKYEMTPEEALTCKKDIDMENATKEIKIIKKELKDIGDVSIASIEEYEEVSERYLFLKAQHDDLVEAKNALTKLIKELEKVMAEKFSESFETVKLHFAEIFEKLFVGGQAELSISDMDNILESDISIDIQPPGKKLQNISLLSGGEKALTAIALLFSILKTKPAPFCILDEIEAALDDVNVYRFADFLKEFTKNSQFVIITHRKGTMEIADNLFGVTMQEFGISKMLSVKLEDAIVE